MDPQLLIQGMGCVLLALLAYLGQEVRSDVRNIRSRLHTVEGGQNILMAVLKTKGLLDGDFELPEERKAA